MLKNGMGVKNKVPTIELVVVDAIATADYDCTILFAAVLTVQLYSKLSTISTGHSQDPIAIVLLL